MTSARRLWLLCGLAFSGKSALAAKLASLRDMEVVSLDAINEERGVGFGGDGLSPSVWAETLDLAVERVDAAMQRGVEILVDDTNCFRWIRDRYRDVARCHGYEVVVIQLDVPTGEILRRRRSNEADPERRPIADEVFRQHEASFEWPLPDETTVRTRGEEIGAWLADPGPR